MTTENTPKPIAAENPKIDLDEGQKVSKRAADISVLIHSQLQQHFPVAALAEEQMPLTEREEAAFTLARREVDIEHAKQIFASLQLTAPQDFVAIQEAKDKYHIAREKFQKQAEFIARRTGHSHADALRNMRDWIHRVYKQGMSALRQHPVVAFGAAGASVYALSGLFARPGVTNAGTSLVAAVGKIGFLPWIVNGGLVTGAAAVGYGLGKLLGKAIGAERAGKYVGMLGGGLGTAAALGLTASSVAWSAGIPLGVYGGWKLGKEIYRYLRPAQKFDVKEMDKEAERRREGAMIVRTIERLRDTNTAVGGDPANPIMARLVSLQLWAEELSTPDPAHTLVEVQTEWGTLKPEAEETIKAAQKRTNDRAPEVRSAESVRAQCLELRDRWARLPGVPAPSMSADLRAALTGIEAMITDFVSATPSHSLKVIEDAHKVAEAKFEKAWEKQLQRTDDVRKINMLTAQCNELRNRWNTALPVSVPRPSLPAAVVGALEGIDRMVIDFATTNPNYSPKAVEDAFAAAEEKFNKAWEKAVQRSEDMRKVGTYSARCDEMRNRWAALPTTPTTTSRSRMPDEVTAALMDLELCISDFTSPTPRYLAKDVEDAFKISDEKFKVAWEKALQRTDAEIPELGLLGAVILADINNIYGAFPALNANHPAAQQAYGLARTARSTAQLANTRLQGARTPDDARKQFDILRAQEDIVILKIEEAQVNVRKADTIARQAILAVGQILPADIAAMSELPRRFQDMRRYMNHQLSEETTAKQRGANNTELDQIWVRNRTDIGRTRGEIDQLLNILKNSTSWPKADVLRLSTDFAGAFAAITGPDFQPVALKGMLDDAEGKLKRSTQEAMEPLVGDLTALRLVAGEGAVMIDRVITQCGNISGLPSPNSVVQLLILYRDQTTP